MCDLILSQQEAWYSNKGLFRKKISISLLTSTEGFIFLEAPDGKLLSAKLRDRAKVPFSCVFPISCSHVYLEAPDGELLAITDQQKVRLSKSNFELFLGRLVRQKGPWKVNRR